MRLSLFWKILLGFWIAFIIAVQLLWVVVTIHHDAPEDIERQITWRVASVIDALRHGGPRELELILRTWPEKERDYVKVNPIPAEYSGQVASVYFPESKAGHYYSQHRESEILYNEYVMAPDEKLYQVQYDAKKLRDEYLSLTDRYLFNIHEPLLFLGLFGGFIFSSFMAWNLSKPLKVIREGFYRVSNGDLSVRLLPELRHRKDEITDVARDFDLMVDTIHHLSSAREALLHDISHELRTPLTRIRIALGLAQQNMDNIPKTLARVAHETDRLEELVSEVLSLARIENENVLDEDYFDLDLLIDVLVEEVKIEADNKKVNINFSVQTNNCSWLVRGKAELIRRAFENVLRNAIKYSNAAQTVYFSLFEEKNMFVALIRDEGPGVPEDKLNFIFEAFGRLQYSNEKIGYGLGLSISKKAILAHNGEIQAKNHPQGGLIIRIAIPKFLDE
ncbi:HAMP domain-containing sensor histidine kinase [Thorsellia kenyensis]|uniref:histidine kinase n=1 Tax=Thorsellia kenyensis TaxID=1549888 RepID=A0ABV6C8C2_9GAMM